MIPGLVRAVVPRIGLLALSALAKLAGAAAVLLLAHTLGATGRTDALLLVQTVWLTVQTLAAAGFTQTLVYELQGQDGAARRVTFAPHWAFICLYAALATAAGALFGLMAPDVDSPLVRYGTLALLFSGPGLLAQFALQRLIEQGAMRLVVAAPALPSLAMGATLVVFGTPDADTAMLAWCLGTLLECAVLVVASGLWRELGWPRWTHLRQGLHANLPFVAAYALFVPNSLIDTLFASRLGEGALSAFQFGMRFPVFAAAVVAAVLAPIATHRFAAASDGGVNAVVLLVRKHVWTVSAGSLAVGIAGGLAAFFVLPQVLRDPLVAFQAVFVAIFGAGAALGSVAGTFLGKALGSLRSARPVIQVAAIALAARIALDASLSELAGLTGLAAACSLAAGLAVTLQYRMLLRHAQSKRVDARRR